MQTLAEKELINAVAKELRRMPEEQPRILDVGAGRSLVIENELRKRKLDFVADRVDVEDCAVKGQHVGRCWVASVEAMPHVPSEVYPIAFANFVLEHVPRVDKAAKEIARVLKPGGIFVASVANPAAPEFVISRYTPLWFHQLIKGKGEGRHAFETHYAYADLEELAAVFGRAGFELETATYIPFTYGYLYRFPAINLLSRAYDSVVGWSKMKALMGHACLVWRKK
jgi:ubiquinone/menaquinone biosynthesis C-methylase UbiE